MKKLIFNALVFTAAFIIPILGLAQEPLQLTLDQALEIALSESNTIKIADMTVEKTGYAKKAATPHSIQTSARAAPTNAP